MTPIDLFREWLSGVPNIREFNLNIGHWLDFDGSSQKQYITFQIVGGPPPREIYTRMINFSVTLVGRKDGNYVEVEKLAEAVSLHAEQLPEQCPIVTVNMLGQAIGPLVSEGGRPVMTMTLQMII